MGKGRELADARGCRLVALVGMSPEGSLGDLEHLVCAGADEVLACRDERLRQNDAEVYARLICDLVAERKPEAILYGATAFGRELAPGVAVRLQTGLTADCTVLSMDAETGLLQQTRPAFGGNLMATIICPNHRPPDGNGAPRYLLRLPTSTTAALARSPRYRLRMMLRLVSRSRFPPRSGDSSPRSPMPSAWSWWVAALVPRKTCR